MALPLPSVVANVGPGGPLVTGLEGMNALQKSAAEARYAPYQAYGNAFLTNQEAQWVPYKYQMQALANPLLWMAAQNNPALMNQLKTLMSNPLAAVGSQGGMGNNMGIPLPGQANGLLGMLMNTLNVSNRQQPTNAMTTIPTAGQSIGSGSSGYNANRGYEYDSSGKNVRATDEEINNAGGAPTNVGYNTPASTSANNLSQQGGMSGANPYSAAQAAQKGMEAAVTGQTTNQVNQQSERSKAISNQSQIAKNALDALKGFHHNYQKSSYKGQYLGNKAEEIPTLPGGTIAPEQSANRYANQFLTVLSGLGDTPAGKTDEGRSLIAAGKVDLSLEPQAEEDLYRSFEAKLTRMMNLRNFANDFYKNNPNATDEQLVGMMNAYNRYAPAYDYAEGKPLPDNEKRFKDFTSSQALQTYINQGDYNPYKNKKNPSSDNKSGYDPLTILNFKYNNAQEFKDAFNTLNSENKEKVIAEMKRREKGKK